jgi:arsenate reductase (thioredoxin)
MSKPEPAPRVLKILFVCVGNSCRSQMAEAFANKLAEGRVRAWSAGSHPLGEIIPETLTVLEEEGILLDGHWSKPIKEVPVAAMDAVVSMGCEVVCPIPEGFKGRVIEWNIPDPFGHDLGYFRSVRDRIERQVRALLEELQSQQESSPSGGEA